MCSVLKNNDHSLLEYVVICSGSYTPTFWENHLLPSLSRYAVGYSKIKVTSYQASQPIGCVWAMKLSTVGYQLWYSSTMKKCEMTLEASNVLYGKFYIKIKKEINLYNKKTFWELYMQENVTLFLWEFWREWNLISYTGNHCTHEMLTWEMFYYSDYTAFT